MLVTEKSKQLIEVGWLGGLQELRWGLTQQSFSVKDVTHFLIIHYHIDHGALAQEMKDKGAKFIVIDSQRQDLDT